MTVSPHDIAAATRTLLVGATGAPAAQPVGPQLFVPDPADLANLPVDLGTPATVFTAADHVTRVTRVFPGVPVVVVEGDITALDDLYLEPAHCGHGDVAEDRKSTSLNPVTNAHPVCRLPL